MKQAVNLTCLPFVLRHVALMPDCHSGYGMPIGGVIACLGAVVPNAVGVDIGCGMLAVKTGAAAAALSPNRIAGVLREMMKRVPLGFEHHRRDQPWDGFDRAPGIAVIRTELASARRQLGTLGGGNHFIELQAGGDGALWLMIHSGSRNFGYRIARHYHDRAAAWCAKTRQALPDRDLAWLPLDTQEAREYLAAMDYALEFARVNRERMRDACLEVLAGACGAAPVAQYAVHHNFAAPETHFGRQVIVHRKGATAAPAGGTGIIPGSMGTPSYIVCGLGNPDSFASSSHGAGRVMGRNEANRRLTERQAREAMAGVVCPAWPRDRTGAIDLGEAPQAYKNIDEVMAAQTDLVEVKEKLRPIGVLKG